MSVAPAALAAVLLATTAVRSCDPGTPPPGGSCGTDTGTVDPLPAGDLVAPDRVRLPFAAVGEPAPAADLLVQARGGEVEALQITTTGPFSAGGATEPLAEGETRVLQVAWAGSLDTPTDARGTITLTAGDQARTVEVGAVIGAPDLPAAPTWSDDGDGLSATVAMPSAPYPVDGGAWTDPSVWVWLPHGLTTDAGVVTHLHGHYAVLDDMLAAKDLLGLVARSGRDAVFVVPQGPVHAASGDFGKLMEPGGHAALVRDTVALLYREGLLELPPTGPQVLTAHSGGYRAAARILEHGGLPIEAVHLFDALYGEVPTYRAFAAGGGILRSSYTAWGGTVDQNEALAQALGVPDDASFDTGTLQATAVTIGPSSASHAAVMGHDDAYATWLGASGLQPVP